MTSFDSFKRVVNSADVADGFIWSVMIVLKTSQFCSLLRLGTSLLSSLFASEGIIVLFDGGGICLLMLEACVLVELDVALVLHFR